MSQIVNEVTRPILSTSTHKFRDRRQLAKGATGYHEERGTQGPRYHRSPIAYPRDQKRVERLEESRTKVSDLSED